MSDSTTQAPAIRKYINLHQDYEARYWSEKFNVSRDELESVVTKSARWPMMSSANSAGLSRFEGNREDGRWTNRSD
jgi:Protein of unknown function (DUF3606)